MSSRNWPEYGTGFVVTDQEISNFIAFFKAEDPQELCEAMDPKGETWRYYDESVDGQSFIPFADGYDSEQPETMLVIWAAEQPNPFHAAYPGGIGEMIVEYRNLLGKYLPGDFDYKAHLGYFSGSVYC